MAQKLSPHEQHELELLVTKVRDLLSPLDNREDRLDALRRADACLVVNDELAVIQRRYGAR